MSLSTPALLFGSISLLFLAYTNRFTTLAKFIRELCYSNENNGQVLVKSLIPILRKRLQLIKGMQITGVISFILCTGSLFSIFLDHQFAGKLFFTLSLLSLIISLIFVLWEVSISTKALDNILYQTDKLKHKDKKNLKKRTRYYAKYLPQIRKKVLKK